MVHLPSLARVLALCILVSLVYVTAVDATSIPSRLPVSSSSSTASPVPIVVSIVAGCGWTRATGVVYGCNGDERTGRSNLTLSVNRVDLLPAGWELAVGDSRYSVRGEDFCTSHASDTVVVCGMPYMASDVWGQQLPIWLQDADKQRLTGAARAVVYAAPPTISSVVGCSCPTDESQQTTYGCGLEPPMLTVLGSGFARAWDGSASSTESPITLVNAYRASYRCVVSSFTDWMLVCSSLQPIMVYNDGSLLQLSVSTGAGADWTSNSWHVQFGTDTCGPTNSSYGSSSSTGSAGSTGSSGPLPHIDYIIGGTCQAPNLVDSVLLGCWTDSASLFTIIGSGFDVPFIDGIPVQLYASASSSPTYTCGAFRVTAWRIECISLQPALAAEAGSTLLRVQVVTEAGGSNWWEVQLQDNGPYAPSSTASASSSTEIAGLDFVTFVVVICVVGAVAALVLSLAVVSCCCGVAMSSLLHCCDSGSSSSLSSVRLQSASSPLLVPPPSYAVDAALPYSSSSSRFGLSLPPDPSNYPAVPAHNGGY